jgi:hypothetical protein
MPDTETIRQELLSTDDEFRGLFDEHHAFESRLSELSEKHYLSEPEQIEAATLKKRKLLLKDRMEQIMRRYRSASRGAPPRIARSESISGG